MTPAFVVVVAIIAYARPTTSCIPKGAEVRLSDKVVGVATLNARNAINKHMVSIAKIRGLVNGPGLRQRHGSTKFSIKLLFLACARDMVSIAKTRGLVNGPGWRQRHGSTTSRHRCYPGRRSAAHAYLAASQPIDVNQRSRVELFLLKPRGGAPCNLVTSHRSKSIKTKGNRVL